jgi:hypothetical protein
MDPQRPAGARPAPTLLERLLPPVMDARDLYARQARAWGALAAVTLVVALAAGKDEGMLFGVAIAAFFGLRAWLNVRKLRQARAGEQVAMYVDGLPPAERAPALRRSMWLGGIGAGVLSAWSAVALWSLESGQAERADVWGPVAAVYERFGFWPAVLLCPAFGVLIVGSAWTKLRKLEKSSGGVPRTAA